MTTYELLRSSENLLRLIVANRIALTDVTHLEIFAQYEKMKKEGHKVGYITVHLADKYGMTERGIYKVVRRLSKNVEFPE
jgi:hypothetical protein